MESLVERRPKMTTQGHTGGRAARSTEQGDERRVLVIAAERCVGAELVDDLRRRLNELRYRGATT